MTDDLHLDRRGKPALDVLRELMGLAVGLAAFHQPRPVDAGLNPNYNEQAFRYYAEFAKDCAKAIAAYEAPKLQAVAVAAPPPEQRTTRFRLNIFDRVLRLPPVIDGDPPSVVAPESDVQQ
jgi:hypothetical protein